MHSKLCVHILIIELTSLYNTRQNFSNCSSVTFANASKWNKLQMMHRVVGAASFARVKTLELEWKTNHILRGASCMQRSEKKPYMQFKLNAALLAGWTQYCVAQNGSRKKAPQ